MKERTRGDIYPFVDHLVQNDSHTLDNSDYTQCNDPKSNASNYIHFHTQIKSQSGPRFPANLFHRKPTLNQGYCSLLFASSTRYLFFPQIYIYIYTQYMFYPQSDAEHFPLGICTVHVHPQFLLNVRMYLDFMVEQADVVLLCIIRIVFGICEKGHSTSWFAVLLGGRVDNTNISIWCGCSRAMKQSLSFQTKRTLRGLI